MTKEVSVAVSVAPNSFSAQLDLAGVDPVSVIGRLSKSLGPNDSFAIFGSQDPASSGASPNLTYIGNVLGSNDGGVSPSPKFGGWRFLFLQRLLGGNPGTFFASGNGVFVAPIPPISVALPGPGAFASLSLGPLDAPVRLALSANMTATDVFALYGTDDPTATSVAGATFIGNIQGGGTAQGTNGLSTSTSIVPNQLVPGFPVPNARDITAYANILVARVGGNTPGFLYAWSATDSSSATISAPTALNKNMPALTTASVGNPPAPPQLACAAAIAATPVGYVEVVVNGVSYEVANGPAQVTISNCYFAPAPGLPATARTLGVGSANPVQAGDFLYWNGTATGFDLAAPAAPPPPLLPDLVDFLYNV